MNIFQMGVFDLNLTGNGDSTTNIRVSEIKLQEVREVFYSNL
jgi:hypothetical protein